MNTKREYEHQSLVKVNKRRVGGAIALLLLLPLAAWAGGVVTNCTEADLRTAMAGGGAVTFACDGTITLASTITNVNDTTLDGSGRQVTISGHSAVRVFSIATNVHFTVVNLTIADGTSLGGSAILNLGGTANLNGVTFRSNTAIINYSTDALSPKGGGAIFNRGGTVNASNCSFARNTVCTPDGSGTGGLVCGGAIRNEAGLLALRSCSFTGNQAVGATYYPDNLSTRGDTARGGAIHNSGTATLDLCTLAGNSATGGASGVVLGGPGLSGGEGSGGAIYNEGTLTTDRTTLCGNTATGGAGSPGCSSPQYGLDGFPGGPGANALGAAICNLGSLWVTCSTLASNVVTGGYGGGGGGGLYLGVADSGNGASGGNGGSGLGGALHNSGAASLVNCTIAYNTGNGRPGGSGGTSEMPTNPRRHQGAGGNGGGGGSGFGGVDGTCNLINCTLASNQGVAGLGGGAGGGNPPGTPGTSGSAWGGTACGPMVNTLIVSNTPAGGDTFPDPKLGPLGDNGGPTLTMALLPGSPAIDAGNTSLAPATDQRGFPRRAGLAADIGAFEFGSVMQGPPLVSTLPATGVSTNSAVLNGTVDPLDWPTTAWFQWGVTTNYGNLTSVTALSSEAAALPLSAPLAGLTPTVTYHFRVAATNDYGLAYGSDESFTTLVPLPPVSTLSATGVSTNSATLNGTVNPNGWPTTAWFQWGATTNYGNLTSVTNLGSGSAALPLSAPLAGLTPSVTYHFRVAATNDYGMVCGSDQSFTTLGPPLVSTLPATWVSATSATLNGTVSPQGWPTTAWFQWGPTTSYGNATSVTDLGRGTSALPLSAPLVGLSLDVTYHFRVAATNDNGVVYGSDGIFTTGSLPTEFYYSITNGAITITGYTGPGGDVVIPYTFNGLPVTSIGQEAFLYSGLRSITIPDSVTNISDGAFAYCTNLTSATIPNSVSSIGWNVFFCCYSLASVTIPNSVTSIPQATFWRCSTLSNITIPDSVTNIGEYAFCNCFNLTALHFGGNAPSLGGPSVFSGDDLATVYYLPGTTGWGTTFGGCPTASWYLPNPLILTSGTGFGVQSNAFGFIISWATNLPVVVEACTNPANHSWSAPKTNALTGGWSYFSDPQWTNYSARFYRLRWP